MSAIKILIISLTTMGFFCCKKNYKTAEDPITEANQLYNNVWEMRDVESYITLHIASYGYYHYLDSVQLSKMDQMDLFMAESGYIPAYNEVYFSSMRDNDSIDPYTDIDFDNIYYLLKCFAYGYYTDVDKFCSLFGLEDSIADDITRFRNRQLGNPSILEGSDEYLSLHQEIESMAKHVVSTRDTTAFMELRTYRGLTCAELLPIAQFMADSVSFLTAFLDTYESMLNVYGYPFRMDDEAFSTAYYYLQYAVDHDYLPAIWCKSLLLLTGTYMPQDTIEGKRLLNMCLKNPPCQTPFWRR